MPEVWPRVCAQTEKAARQLGDAWHLDEVVITIQGKHQYLWRAVDQDGDTIDILVQRRRNKKAAVSFFRRLLNGQGGEPRWLYTDKLKSYGAAHREVMPTVEHINTIYANNRVEVSHQPTRQQESICAVLLHRTRLNGFSRS